MHKHKSKYLNLIVTWGKIHVKPGCCHELSQKKKKKLSILHVYQGFQKNGGSSSFVYCQDGQQQLNSFKHQFVLSMYSDTLTSHVTLGGGWQLFIHKTPHLKTWIVVKMLSIMYENRPTEPILKFQFTCILFFQTLVTFSPFLKLIFQVLKIVKETRRPQERK